MKKQFSIILVFLLIAALLTGCSAKTKKADSYDSGYYYAEPAEYAMADSAAGSGYGRTYVMTEAAEEEAAPAPNAKGAKAEAGTQPTGRKIIRNADLSLQTREYDTFMADLEGRIAACGGYIESSYTSGNSYSSRKTLRSAELVVRIPSDRLDGFLDGVCTIGNVLYKNVYSSDVTASYVDTEARLSALRTERDTLMELLGRAEKMEDVIVIYDRISEVTYEIESYESRLRTYDDQISYSTVSVSVKEVEREKVVEKEGTWEEIGRRIRENLEDIGSGLREFFIWFVSSLPRLVIWVLVCLAVYLIVRAIVRKRRRKKAEKKDKPAPKAPAKPAEKADKPEKTAENP